jgi:hypothetical protein
MSDNDFKHLLLYFVGAIIIELVILITLVSR